MRLTSLTLSNYGPFGARRIEFDARPSRINLLVAPNGAGKSVLRGAFADLLFGIHPQTGMDFRFGYAGMQLMAEAIGLDQAPFTFGRRKGKGNTLIGADNAPLEPAVLARLLGHTDRTLLERLFALDTDRLRDGGSELLASGGAVADALLSAAGGLRQPRRLRRALDDARDQLAPERKVQGRPFYQSLDRFLAARQAIETTVLKPEARERQQTEFAHLQGQQQLHEAHARAASARIAMLERVRRVAGPLRQHDDAAAWLAANEAAPTLPADTAARLAAAREAVLRADLLVARAGQAVREAAERGGTITCDIALLDAAEAIDALATRAGSAGQAAADIPLRVKDLAVEEARTAALLHQLGSPLPVARAAEAIPRDVLVADARRLFTDHETLRPDLERLPGELDAAARTIAATEAELAQLGPPPAVDAGTDAAEHERRDIARAGDPARQAMDAERQVARLQAAFSAACARIPAWGERAAGLPVQPLPGYECLAAACDQASTALDAAAGETRRLAREIAAGQARLNEIAAEGALADETTVAAARLRRDAGWRLVYRHAFTPAPPSLAEDADWAGAEPLPIAYERAVTAADASADLRSREAERIARAGELLRRHRELQGQLADAQADHAAATLCHDAAAAAWYAALAPFGLDSATGLPELRALLAGRDAVIDARRDLTAAQGDRSALECRQAADAARLAGALSLAPERTGADLPGLLALAEQRVSDAQKAREAHNRLHERLVQQSRAAADRQAVLTRTKDRMAALLAKWGPLRDALQRPTDEAPATTVALLDLFARLGTATDKAATLRLRLDEMHAEVAQFAADAAALAGRVAPDLMQADAMAAMRALRGRLTEQRGLARQKQELVAQCGRAAAVLDKERDAQSAAAIGLRTLLATIGAADLEAAGPIVALAAERDAVTAARHGAAQVLAGMADDRTTDALRAEVAGLDADTIPGEIDAAAEARDGAWQQIKALGARIATDGAAMAMQAAETATAQAEFDRQAAAATLGRVLDEALVLHVAGLMLEEALGAVDAAGTSGLLARIGGLFATLTGGAYERVVAAEHGDGARLLAVERGFAQDRREVKELSDGTRDQLFLALRLAAIEEHVAAAPALPFVADDILQTFDDDRAVAALHALVALSAHVQVILLSHHPHLLDLARALGPNLVHVCKIGQAVAMANA